MDLDTILSFLKGGSAPSTPEPQGKTYTSSPRLNYPTSDDVDFARKYDYSYGQPWAPEFEGKSARLLAGSPESVPMPATVMGAPKPLDTLVPQAAPLKDVYAKAALAAEGSPLAKLGFDPNRMALDLSRDPRKVNIEGRYRPATDEIYANARLPDVLVHESMHRGIQKLQNSPFWQKEFDPMVEGLNNEMMVRHLMQSKMGDPEAAIDSWAPVAKQQRSDASYLFNKSHYADQRQQTLNKMEDAAAQYIAAKRPGGPR
jgi:hypothetical protein